MFVFLRKSDGTAEVVCDKEIPLTPDMISRVLGTKAEGESLKALVDLANCKPLTEKKSDRYVAYLEIRKDGVYVDICYIDEKKPLPSDGKLPDICLTRLSNGSVKLEAASKFIQEEMPKIWITLYHRSIGAFDSLHKFLHAPPGKNA
jgi:hypothetical protein